jgi:hypothetical protein
MLLDTAPSKRLLSAIRNIQHHIRIVPKSRLIMLYSPFLSTILSLCSFSCSLPIRQWGAGSCNALLEISPWQISDIVVRGDLLPGPTGSSIQFRAQDINPGLEFETYCRWSSPVVTGPRCQETRSWHPCENERVRFLYQRSNLDRPDNLQIRRSYFDDWYVTRNGLMDDVNVYIS